LDPPEHETRVAVKKLTVNNRKSKPAFNDEVNMCRLDVLIEKNDETKKDHR